MPYPPRNLKVYDKPTLFNKEMAIGFLLGGGPITALIGGLIGKARMDNEAKYGRTVGEPTGWNKDALLGGLLGNAVGALAVGVVAVTLGLPVGIAAFGGVIGTAGGALLGANLGKAKMTQEYEYAGKQGAYFAEHGASKAAEVNLEPQVEQTTYRDMVTGQAQGAHHR